MNRRICEAIAQRRRLRFRYDNTSRVVEPHCHGVTGDGNELLRAYQVQGGSSRGERKGWKLFEVDKMKGLRQTDEMFERNRRGYEPRDSAMARICCHV